MNGAPGYHSMSPDQAPMSPPPEIRVVKTKALVRVPLRLRLRHWWSRRRMDPTQRELLEQWERSYDEWVLNGRPLTVLPPEFYDVAERTEP